MATSAPPGVMDGGRLVRVERHPGGVENDVYYMIYEFPQGSKQFLAYQFNDVAQVEKTFGKGTVGPLFKALPSRVLTEDWWAKHVIATGAAEEVIGSKEHYNSYLQRLMKTAADKAGVRDPSLAGKIANNVEMQRIMAQAVVGKWTTEQVKAAQRQTKFWKNTLYPGIESFYGQTEEPERAWVNYRNAVSPILRELGYQPDANGTFNAQVSKMLKNKIDAETFINQAPTFIRAVQNQQFAQTLNQWAEQELGKQVTFNDWFDLMAGESTPELNAVAEKATLAWTAQNQGSQVTDQQIQNLAANSQLSEQEAVAAFSEFNQSILALGDEGLQRYGLTRDEVLSVAAGVNPQSGKSIDETKLLIAKTARELGMADDEKINFYVGFSPSGQPTRPGLQSLAPESA